jgi:hypothetical protein
MNAALLVYAAVALPTVVQTSSQGSRNRLFAIIAALVLRDRRRRRDLE